MLLKICTELPKEMQGITACCNPMPPLVKQHLQLLHLIVLKAREKPLVRVDIEMSLVHQTPAPTLSSEVTEDPLKTPFDLSHITELHGESLLEGAELGAAKGNARLNAKRKPTLTVFDQDSEITERLRVVTFLSPYQRYQMLKPYLQYMKEVDKTKAEAVVSDQQRIDSIKLHFEALTAMTTEEYNEERDNADEPVAEEGNAEESEGDEHESPEGAVTDGDIKPLRVSKNYWKKRKRPQKNNPGKKPKLEPVKEDVEESTPDRLTSSSIDYENADFGAYASRQSDRNSTKGQFNPDAQLRAQKQEKTKRKKFAKRGKSFTYNKKN
jgi:exosome complex exonuclease RRP6